MNEKYYVFFRNSDGKLEQQTVALDSLEKAKQHIEVYNNCRLLIEQRNFTILKEM